MGEKSMFYKTHRDELQRLEKGFERQLLEDVVPFWSERLEDQEYGGYLTCFDRQGRLSSDIKPGWFVGRSMYCFALLYNTIEKRPEWLHLAQVGRDYMDTAFARGDGRFNQMMSRDGRVINGFTSLFTDHFAVKGFYEYLTASGLKDDIAQREYARALTEKLLRDVEDPTVLQLEGVPRGMKKHAINFMTLIVALESRQIFENDFKMVWEECTRQSLYVFANDEMQAPFEYVRIDGTPQMEGEGRLVDPGHTMESLWFSMHAGEASQKPEYILRASTILDWVLERTYDREFGGFYQHVDVDTTVPQKPWMETQYDCYTASWDDKIWWIQAEGLYALAASALYTENERHWRYFIQMVDYVENAMRDHVWGEWYAILNRDGSPKVDCKGFALKGPYHVPRALVNLCVLVRRYLEGSLPVVRSQ
ncbi:MAG: AGE family epimerase/isomerase [Lachnospiraceae bacterium]|nr:AGE family epimerase/isomerase [Lachnospiraceae bacterium]